MPRRQGDWCKVRDMLLKLGWTGKPQSASPPDRRSGKKRRPHLPEGGIVAIILVMIRRSDEGQEGLIEMIEVTEAASKAIKAFMEERQLNSALRVYLQAGG